MRIEAVIWDYGGVFCGSPFSAMASVAIEMGIDPGRYLGTVFGPYEQDTDHPWHRLERGEIGLELARDEIIALGKRDDIDADPYHLFGAMVRAGGAETRDDVVEFAVGLKRDGMMTGLITNNAAEFREHWRKSIPIDDLFHHVIDSSEVGLRKPDPRIFELALEKLGGVSPEQAVFVDDFEGNVEAARRVGLRGVHMTEDYAAALDELRALLR